MRCLCILPELCEPKSQPSYFPIPKYAKWLPRRHSLPEQRTKFSSILPIWCGQILDELSGWSPPVILPQLLNLEKICPQMPKVKTAKHCILNCWY